MTGWMILATMAYVAYVTALVGSFIPSVFAWTVNAEVRWDQELTTRKCRENAAKDAERELKALQRNGAIPADATGDELAAKREELVAKHYKNRELNPRKGRGQFYAVVQYALPMGLASAAAIGYVLFYHHTVTAYAVGGAIWVATAWLRRLWLIAQAVRLSAKLHDTGVDKTPLKTRSIREAVQHYYRWGAQRSTEVPFREPWRRMLGRYRFLNVFPIVLERIPWTVDWLARRSRIVLPLLVSVVVGAIWPVAWAFETFGGAHDIYKVRPAFKPYWRTRAYHMNEPKWPSEIRAEVDASHAAAMATVNTADQGAPPAAPEAGPTA